ncbi:MAG: hypothetical protein IJJ26_00350, partial [Victivallales bacterium]|nr:hypothetical protein [Victivallales bacterium]
SWESAKNDGERWRWLLGRLETIDASEAQYLYALALYMWFADNFARQPTGQKPFTPEHLSEEEIAVWTETGAVRLKFPPEHNYIAICRKVLEENGSYAGEACSLLAGIFERRRQYGKAHALWRQYAKWNPVESEERCRKIEMPQGSFVDLDPGYDSVDGTFQFDMMIRNSDVARCVVWEIDQQAIAQKFKDSLKTALDLQDEKAEQMIRPFRRFFAADQDVFAPGKDNLREFLSKQIRSWDEKVTRAADYHFASHHFRLPDFQPGMYLLELQIPGEMTEERDAKNRPTKKLVQVTHRLLLQYCPFKVLRTPVTGTPALHGEEARTGRVGSVATSEQMRILQVVDTRSGAPVPKVKLELLGMYARWNGEKQRRMLGLNKETGDTDEDGFYFRKPIKEEKEWNFEWDWTLLLTDPQGIFSVIHYGSEGFLRQRWYDDHIQSNYFGVSDRPVYRPGDTVHLRVWGGQPELAKVTPNPFAGKKMRLQLYSPEHKLTGKYELLADSFGGVSFDWKIPDDAKLGTWMCNVNDSWIGLSFRVEEYKKPEFEVLVEGPSEPVSLGDTLEFQVKAKYYFGSPVAGATAHICVLREEVYRNWWPIGPWDWFYGNGYWWETKARAWLPGWERWGCVRIPGGHPWTRPEVVFDQDITLDENGQFRLPVETAAALKNRKNCDHRYTITAEVRDLSRRTIVGTGSAIAARDPFHVYAWTNGGYCRIGESAILSAQARSVDGKPVRGTAKVRLLQMDYSGETVAEKPVREWTVELSPDGRLKERFSVSRAGQFRFSVTVKDAQGREVEGGCFFSAFGSGDDARDFRFQGLELTPDKREYAPGDIAHLAVSTERAGSTVMLLVRPERNEQTELRILRLEGKTALVDIPVTAQDMPNFFVDAWTVSEGVSYHVQRELFVPPEKRILQVDLQPQKPEVAPGAKTQLEVRVTDLSGKPVQGSVTVAVYDRSLDYIADRTNTDIRQAFYRGKRHYSPFSIYAGVYIDTLGADLGGGVRGPLRSRMKDVHWAYADNVEAKGVADGAMMKAMPAAVNGAAMAPVGAERQEAGGESAEAPVAIRTNFADTALWVGCVETDADGRAVLPFTVPESLTSWSCQAWAVTTTTSVGSGQAQFATAKDLMVRLQAPRFFTETDEVVLSALVDNRKNVDMDVQVVLTSEDGLHMLEDAGRRAKVPAGGQARVEWRMRAEKPGSVKIRVTAVGKGGSDGMEVSLPVKEYGIEKQVAVSRAMTAEERQTEIALEIPKEIRGSARVEVRWSPSLALAMTDALPYLIAYPYGCTEQTLNRFVPAVLAQKTLQKLGIDLASLKKRRSNLNAQELGDAAQRAAQWKRYDRKGDNPVFDEEEMENIVRKGVADLAKMQCSDGGWGWFSGYGEHSWAHETARVVHGLFLARENGVKVPEDSLKRGVEWLERQQLQSIQELIQETKEKPPRQNYVSHLDALVFLVLCEVGKPNPQMAEFLCRDRERLGLYTKALVAQGLLRMKDARNAEFTRNLRQFLQQDEENQTAWLDLGQSYWWYWYGDMFETQAAFLKLILAENPKDPVAPRLVKYLLNNRKNGTYWRSTRDTAACLEAFAEYLLVSGENEIDTTVEVLLDGKTVATSRLTRENLFDGELAQVAELSPGAHTLVVRHTGKSPLYVNSYLSYFTKEEQITEAGLEVKVARKVYRLEKGAQVVGSSNAEGRPIEKRIDSTKRVELRDGDEVKSGDELEVELIVTSKNDYEYLCLEDRKAAGTEPIDVRSGYRWRDGLSAYVEFRDDRVALMVRNLPQGTHSLFYRVRAEIPGRYTALPAILQGMYAPELRANSSSLKLKIQDKPTPK